MVALKQSCFAEQIKNLGVSSWINELVANKAHCLPAIEMVEAVAGKFNEKALADHYFFAMLGNFFDNNLDEAKKYLN